MKKIKISTLVLFSGAMFGCGGSVSTPPVWDVSITNDQILTQSLIGMDDSQITRFASSATGQSNAAVYSWNGDLVSQRELP